MKDKDFKPFALLYPEKDTCKHVHKDWPEGSKCEDCYFYEMKANHINSMEDNSPHLNVRDKNRNKNAEKRPELTADISTLSDKIRGLHPDGYLSHKGIPVEDVREFIKKNEEDIFIHKDADVGTALRIFIKRMRKLAGDKLC